MKKILAVALVLCLVLAVAPMAFADNPVVKIGVFEPQSGDNGAGGKQEILGMQYANQLTPTVDIDGTTYDVELVYADNASANDKAPTAAQSPAHSPGRETGVRRKRAKPTRQLRLRATGSMASSQPQNRI